MSHVAKGVTRNKILTSVACELMSQVAALSSAMLTAAGLLKITAQAAVSIQTRILFLGHIDKHVWSRPRFVKWFTIYHS
jgi:hypothetical protein